jgi:hypothetical protein
MTLKDAIVQFFLIVIPILVLSLINIFHRKEAR